MCGVLMFMWYANVHYMYYYECSEHVLALQAVVAAVDDSFYKITSEALLVLNLIVKTIRPLGKREGEVMWVFVRRGVGKARV